MCISCRDRIPDAIQLEGTSRGSAHGLWFVALQLSVINFPAIPRQGLEGKIQLVERHGAMFYDNLIDSALLSYIAVVAADHRQQIVPPAMNLEQSVRHCEGHLARLQAAHVRHEIHRHDFWRERL